MQRKLTTIFTALAVTLLGATTYVTPVFADEKSAEKPAEKPAVELQLSPTTLVVTTEAGDLLEEDSEFCTTGTEEGCRFTVKNIGRDPFDFKIYITPYTITSEDNEANFSEDVDMTYTQISRWITIRDSNGNYKREVRYHLNPEESVTIPIRIEVPDDVPGGMQRAAIWAEPITSGTSSGTMGVNANVRTPVVIAGRSIGDTSQEAQISDYGFQRFSLGGPLTASATVKNSGNTDFIITSTYTARSFFGKVLYEDEQRTPAYPGVEYHLNTTWENTPYLGIFTVNYSIETGNNKQNETHVVAIMPIPIMILVISLLTVIIIWIIIIIRKRKERKARMLV